MRVDKGRHIAVTPLRTGHESFPSFSSMLTIRVAAPPLGISLNLKLGTWHPKTFILFSDCFISNPSF